MLNPPPALDARTKPNWDQLAWLTSSGAFQPRGTITKFFFYLHLLGQIKLTMAEPQPSTVTEGMDEEAPPLAAAEDRKAAAAMSNLEKRGGDEEAETKPTKQIDQEALGKAISRLELADKGGKITVDDEKKQKEKEEKEKEVARIAKVKVDQADVVLLVDELDLSKTKATQLLKAHEGNAVKALRAFVTASV